MYNKGANSLINEKEILKKISQGDENAFKIFYEYYRKKIYSFALKILKSEDLAEDVLHEVLLKIWQHDSLEKIENIESYCRIASRNQAFKILKKQQLQLQFNHSLAKNWTESRHETEETILHKDTRRIFLEAIEQLSPQQKRVFLLCREEGLKYEEVAERMSISKFTVKTHMQQALRFLKSYLSTYSDITILIFLFQLWNKK